MHIPSNLFKVQLEEKNASSADTEDEEQIEEVSDDLEEGAKEDVRKINEEIAVKTLESEEKQLSSNNLSRKTFESKILKNCLSQFRPKWMKLKRSQTIT